MARERMQGRRLAWAWIGGGILVAGVVAIIVSAALNSSGPAPTPSDSPTTSVSPSAPSTEIPANVVDPAVSDRGWVPEPITDDADVYIRSALEAAATFDTQRGERDAWLSYLDSWFTLDVRYMSDADQRDAMESAQLELRQSVVFPEANWNSLATEDGRVTATVTGEVTYVPVQEDPTGFMTIGTADVILTFTRADNNGSESSYDERVRVSVQVLCGGESVPTPDSDQQSGDCKVVRYFPEPMEP